MRLVRLLCPRPFASLRVTWVKLVLVAYLIALPTKTDQVELLIVRIHVH